MSWPLKKLSYRKVNSTNVVIVTQILRWKYMMIFDYLFKKPNLKL